MLMLKLLDVLYLDGYRSLWDKFRDPDRDAFQMERHWAYNNYRQYMGALFVEHKFRTMMAMRRAKSRQDYLTLYNIMKAIDGDKTAQEWLERDWEE